VCVCVCVCVCVRVCVVDIPRLALHVVSCCLISGLQLVGFDLFVGLVLNFCHVNLIL